MDLAQVRAIQQDDCQALLPCTRDRGGASTRVRLRYDITGCARLDQHLRHVIIDRAKLYTMLADTIEAVDWCAHHVHGDAHMLFEPKSVFVSAGHLRFVLLPVDGMAARFEQSPHVLLRAISDVRHLRLASFADVLCAERIGEFVAEERHAFSLNRLRSFMAKEFPLGTQRSPKYNHSMGSAVHGRYKLCVRQSDDAYVLEGQRTYDLGRLPSCDICLADYPKVSRSHATLRCDEDHAVITDQDSTNGTWVGARRVVPHEEVAVAYGQTFSLSDCSLCLEKG